MRNLAIFVFILSVPVLAKTYSVDGIVVAVDPAARTMLVSHRAIAHYMPAMLMPFRAENAAELAPLHPGARIAFLLSVKHGQSLARNIHPSGEPDAALPLPRQNYPSAPPSPTSNSPTSMAAPFAPPICAAKSRPSISFIRAAPSPTSRSEERPVG